MGKKKRRRRYMQAQHDLLVEKLHDAIARLESIEKFALLAIAAFFASLFAVQAPLIEAIRNAGLGNITVSGISSIPFLLAVIMSVKQIAERHYIHVLAKRIRRLERNFLGKHRKLGWEHYYRDKRPKFLHAYRVGLPVVLILAAMLFGVTLFRLFTLSPAGS